MSQGLLSLVFTFSSIMIKLFHTNILFKVNFVK